MNKQELIEHYEKILDYGFLSVAEEKIYTGFVEKLKQLDEPQKPIVPQVVMDYYEFYRGKLTAFEEWFAKFEVEYDGDFQQMDEVGKWLYDVDFETQTQRELALAMLIVNGSDAVEVEKEKKYKVKFKNVRSGTRYLKYDGVIEKWYFGINQDSNAARLCHTKEELEKAGFGEVFDSPLFEVEEVE